MSYEENPDYKVLVSTRTMNATVHSASCKCNAMRQAGGPMPKYLAFNGIGETLDEIIQNWKEDEDYAERGFKIKKAACVQ